MSHPYLSEGTILNNTYRIVRFIAQGGFGITYEAEHIFVHTRLAIKEFFPTDFCNRAPESTQLVVATDAKLALVTKLRGKFIQEARAIASLHNDGACPGVVKVSDFFEANGTAYYVMDFIDGESLSQMVERRGKLPVDEAVGYITEVAKTLKHIHARKMLHLDIKPANIMIDRATRRPILVDFGVSKQYDQESGENTSTLIGRSKGYAPVEQMAETITQFTPATDIYALGATLYKLLTGITPPPANSRADIDELRPLPATVPAGVRKAVEGAMRISRNNRTNSIDKFLSDMNGAGGDDGGSYGGGTANDERTEITGSNDATIPFTVTKKPKKGKSSAWKWVLIVLLAIVLGVLAYIIYERNRPDYNDYIDSMPSEEAAVPVEEVVVVPEEEAVAESVEAPSTPVVTQLAEGDYNDDYEEDNIPSAFPYGNYYREYLGYFEDNGVQYPVQLDLTHRGDHFVKCVYHNLEYGGKQEMSISDFGPEVDINGHDRGNNFNIHLYKYTDRSFNGVATSGSKTMKVFFEY